MYILIDGLSVSSETCFQCYFSKLSWISDIEYRPSFNLKFSFNAGADSLNLLFLYNIF